MSTTVGVRAPRLAAVTAAGVGLLVLSLLLHFTELSRAGALATAAVAVGPLAAALFARVNGRWPSRFWVLAYGILVAGVLAYGAGLYVYGQLHPPTPS